MSTNVAIARGWRAGAAMGGAGRETDGRTFAKAFLPAASRTAEAPSSAVRPPAAHARNVLMHIRVSFRSPSPMPFVWVGVLLIVLKWFEFEPVATWSWWTILAPLAVAFAWFELLEPLLGFDKRRADDEFAQMREKRIRRQFPYLRARPRNRTAPKG